MFKNMLSSALFAGFAAGLIAAVLQIYFLVPVLLEAELYETGQLTHFGGEGFVPNTIPLEHDWARNGMTMLSTIAIYIGFAMLVVAGIAYADSRGIAPQVKTGLLWGLAGFAAIQLLPSLGLPPELPGMIAAEVTARQIWWAGTVICTLVAIGSFAFTNDWRFWVGGVLILMLPHLIGAPHPEVFGGTVPPELAAQFVGLSLGVGAISWAILGLFSAAFWISESRD